MRTFYVYILTDRHRRILYTGMTNNLERRIHEHRSQRTDNAYSARHALHYLVYFEGHRWPSHAYAREWAIKRMSREQRDALIRAFEADELSCPPHLRNPYAPPKWAVVPPKPIDKPNDRTRADELKRMDESARMYERMSPDALPCTKESARADARRYIGQRKHTSESKMADEWTRTDTPKHTNESKRTDECARTDDREHMSESKRATEWTRTDAPKHTNESKQVDEWTSTNFLRRTSKPPTHADTSGRKVIEPRSRPICPW